MCLLLTQNAISQQKDSLRYEILLNSSMLEANLKTEHFISCIDISSDNYITLSSGNRIYMLGWGGMVPFGNQLDTIINSFSYTNDGLLMTIKNDELCYMNEEGILKKIVQLPTNRMGITSGKDVMYVFDQVQSEDKYKLYAYSKGGKYKQLLVSPQPIKTVTEMKDSLYVAIGSAVFSFSPNEDKLNLLIGFNKDNAIKSMTADTINNILYISTHEGIYALQNESLVYITSDYKDYIIKYFNKGLLVFNPITSDIMRIVNIDKSIKF